MRTLDKLCVSYGKLKVLLDEKHLRWDDLREIANISVRSVSKLENDQEVRMPILMNLCSSLKCDIGDIVEFKTASNTARSADTERLPTQAIVNSKPEFVACELPLTMPEKKPEDIHANFSFIDLFAGIGGIRLGFESVGGHCVFSSEWDVNAAKTYEANFGEKPNGDITKIDPNSIPDFAVLLGGFPCQPFSIIVDKAGFNHETQGTLFFNIEKIAA